LFLCAGYARRGLRSAIASATKDGITVHEVMQPPAGSLGAATAVQTDPAAAAAAAGGAECWGSLAGEMQDVNLQWAASKGGRASKYWRDLRCSLFPDQHMVMA
jgi:hypothetical protein